MLDNQLVVQFLRDYHANQLAHLNIAEYPWENLIRQARRVNLLSRLAIFLRETDTLSSLPKQPQQHFINAIKLSDANARSAKREVKEIYKVLNPAQVDCVLLKGAAYTVINNTASQGRLFTDTDIMVRKEEIPKAEKALAQGGWFTSSLDVYTQRFYREWMHEIPPMTHLKRQTTVDVHHTILPPTSRLKPKAQDLWQELEPVENMPGLFVFSVIDRIIHSATHLFHEGEFDQGLRDISDLDLLIRDAMREDPDCSRLLARAESLDLVIPVYYALNFTQKIIQTPVPDKVLQQAASLANMTAWDKKMMDSLYSRALLTQHSLQPIKFQGLARWFLYIRSHWLKMPVHLLVPHLCRKSWLRLIGEKEH